MTTTQTPTPARKLDTQQSRYWTNGRLVAHISGSEAGLMRLDLDLPCFETAEQAVNNVQLLIPGETAPLNASDAEGHNGRYAISFFSSDIANAGHLPAEATVQWMANGDETQHRCADVKIVSARKVALAHGSDAVNVRPGARNTTYPTTVGLLAIGGLAIALLVVAAMLMAY